jgi:glycosyltransferase involved in cell wall biosynthesis
MKKVAIITPYYEESLDILKRCHDSVINQSHTNIMHVMVADGKPKPEIDDWNVFHLKIPNHNDFGDTPRTLGSISAATLGADAIVFLDGDNWINSDHVKILHDLQIQTNSHIVTATRNIYTIDGKFLGVCRESDGVNFNDTNCYYIDKTAFPVVGAWVFKDSREGITGDRRFWQTINQQGYMKTHCHTPSINYSSNLAFHYQMFGFIPPDTSKVIAKFPGDLYHKTYSYAEFTKLSTAKL